MPVLSSARVLRVIGQDLETRGLKAFDIRCFPDRYEASCGYQAPPAQTPVLLAYTVPEIEEIEIQWQAKPYELYEVQASANLHDWTKAVYPVLPTTATGRLSQFTKTDPALFFRILKVP